MNASLSNLAAPHNVITAATFEEACHQYYAPIERYLMRFLGNKALAADLTQETFARAWRALRQGSVGSRPWLYRIAHNLAIEVYRRRRILRQVPFADLSVNEYALAFGIRDDAAATRFADAIADRDALRWVWQQLSASERTTLTLALTQPPERCARTAAVSSAAFKMRLSRARAHLRELWSLEVIA